MARLKEGVAGGAGAGDDAQHHEMRARMATRRRSRKRRSRRRSRSRRSRSRRRNRRSRSRRRGEQRMVAREGLDCEGGEGLKVRCTRATGRGTCHGRWVWVREPGAGAGAGGWGGGRVACRHHGCERSSRSRRWVQEPGAGAGAGSRSRGGCRSGGGSRSGSPRV